MAKLKSDRKLRFRFRWKYAISAFLVCGVLSLTIGGPGRPDPLLVEAERIQKLSDRLFLLNKDPKTASMAELFGPVERTYPHDSPTLIDFATQVYRFGKLITRESLKRSANPNNQVRGPQITAVASSVKIYGELQLRLYRNYMRLAHDAAFKTYKQPDLLQTVWTKLAQATRYASPVYSSAIADYADEKYLEKWFELNKDIIGVKGAREFSPRYYDSFNILIDTKTAQNLYSEEKSTQMYNLRHVKDAKGNYTLVERFMNEQEKQMAEYLAIQKPKDKGEYLKLVQFSSIREALNNRWAIRRMAGANIQAEVKTKSYGGGWGGGSMTMGTAMNYSSEYETGKYIPLTFSDPKINSCAPDLVSFRLSKPGTINDLEAYSSLWQGDRQVDLMTHGLEPAMKATIDKPLLLDSEYAELIGKYLSNFEYFQKTVIPQFKDKEDELLAALQGDYAPYLRQIEESQWSVTPIEGPQAQPIILAEEAFHFSSFPADDLSISAVADRYVDHAFRLRSYFIAEALWWAADQSTKLIPASSVAVRTNTMVEPDPYAVAGDSASSATGTNDRSMIKAPAYPETKTPESKKLAAKAVTDFMASREQAWKAKLKPLVVKALESKLGFSLPTANGKPAGVGYARNYDQARYDAYAEDLKPIAAIGARGWQTEKAAEKAINVLDARVPRYCPPTYGTGGSGGGDCFVDYANPEKLSKKELEDVNQYASSSVFRNSAKEAGMKNIVLPETPDQLASFFRKKLQVTAEYQYTLMKGVHYKEQDVALKIMDNPVVMRGIDKLFAAVAEAMQKDGGGAPGVGSGRSPASSKEKTIDCNKPLMLGAVKGKNSKSAKRTPSSLTPTDDCSMPDRPDAEPKRAALEKAIIPAAREAYKDFIAGLSEKPKNLYPDRITKMADAQAAKTAEKAKPILQAEKKKTTLLTERVRDNTSAPNGRKFDLSKENFSKPKTADEKKLKELLNKQKKAGHDEVKARLAEVKKAEAEKIKEAEEKKKAAAQFAINKKKWGYFRKGDYDAYKQEGGELYLDNERERTEAKRLYREALGMLGISLDATKGAGKDEAKAERLTAGKLPDRVHSWIMVEWLLKKKYPNARLLERMVITPIDQLAMGKVLMQEASARMPILTLQGTWKVERNWYGKEKEWKNDEEKRPNLLQKLGKIYSLKDGWGDGKAYEKTFKQTLTAAGKSEQGKVETFCKADLKNYRTDENFRTMYMSVSGVRSALTRGADGEEDFYFKQWDDEIQKESRVWSAAFNEDYLDPYVTPIMIAMFCIIAAQLVFAFAPMLPALLAKYLGVVVASGATEAVVAGGAAAVTAEGAAVAGATAAGTAGATAAGTTAAAATTATATGSSLLTQSAKFLGKLIFTQFTGNLGIPGLIFTFQSFIMGHAYLYALPPQMGFTYQLANSQIQSMKGDRLAGMTMVDRDRMAQAREELSSQGLMAEISMIGEFLQFGVFTVPGAVRTFGIKGQAALNRTLAHAPKETVDQVATKTMSDMIAEKGFRKGLKEYWATKGKQVFTKMERVSVVQGTQEAKAGLSTATAARIAHDIPEKKVLRTIYEDALQVEKEALAMLKGQAKNQAKASGLDMILMQQELERGFDELVQLRNRLKGQLNEMEDEAFGSIIITKEYQAVLEAFEKADEEMVKGLVTDERWWNGLLNGHVNKSEQTIAFLKMAKVEVAERKIRLIEKLMKNLDDAPIQEGKPETLAFFEQLGKNPEDIEIHADFLRGKKRWGILGNRKGSARLTAEERKKVKKAYDDLAYLNQDWEVASKWAMSIKNAVQSGEADVILGGKEGKVDPKDLQENPENYEVIRVSESQLGLRENRKKTGGASRSKTVKDAKKNQPKRNGGSN